MIVREVSEPDHICIFYERLHDSCVKYPESDMMCAYIEKEQHHCKWYKGLNGKILTPL